MTEIGYNTLKEKVESLYQRSHELWCAGNVNASEANFDIDLAPLNLVFAGQYSAGKSSLIKMLTGIENIKIGSGVTTDAVTQYGVSLDIENYCTLSSFFNHFWFFWKRNILDVKTVMRGH